MFHKLIFNFLSHGLHKSDFRDFVVRTVSLKHSSLEFFSVLRTASFEFQVFVLRSASISPVSIVPVLRAASFKFQVFVLRTASFEFKVFVLRTASFEFKVFVLLHPSVQFQFFLSYELYPLAAVYFNFFQVFEWFSPY